MLLFPVVASGQLGYTPPAAAAYVSSGGVWVPLTLAASFGSLAYTPQAMALYCQASAGAPWTPCQFGSAYNPGSGLTGVASIALVAGGTISSADTGTPTLTWATNSITSNASNFYFGTYSYANGNGYNCIASYCQIQMQNVYMNSGSGLILGSQFVANGSAPSTFGAGTVTFGGNTAAASNCNQSGVLTGVAGCWVIYVAGTIHYLPYF